MLFAKKLTPMVWFVILLVIACGLALGLPPDPHSLHQLNISSAVYRLAILVVLIPYIVIWYTAFYAFAKLKEYTRSIEDSKDGAAFSKIMIGFGVLAFGLIVPTIVSLVLEDIAAFHGGFRPAATIIVNYLDVLAVIIAFSFVGGGTRRLTRTIKSRPGLLGLRLFTLLIITIGIFFAYLALRNYFRHNNVYYLGLYPLIITLIIPYVYAWAVALLSAYEFQLYSRQASGILYRQALSQLSSGIIVTIAGSVAIQFVDNTLPTKLEHSIGPLIIVIYLLLAIVAVGLILIALGTKKLKKIEDV